MIKALVFAAAAAILSTSAFAYQVTGPVVAVNKDSITVQKGKEKWEIARGDVAFPEDVKVGSKVTVEYNMTASKVESKATTKSASAKDAAKSHDKLAPAAGKKSTMPTPTEPASAAY